MTIKEAILKVLENNKKPLMYLEVLKRIDENKYIDWSNAKTPADTIAAQLGGFIRQNDKRVKRIKSEKGYQYYLSKLENELNPVNLTQKNIVKKEFKAYRERDLHKLLSS